jgi:hypothetical protein
MDLRHNKGGAMLNLEKNSYPSLIGSEGNSRVGRVKILKISIY